METAKLFMKGQSQAVQLPGTFRFESSEVYIKKFHSGVILLPKHQSLWDTWEQNIMKYDAPFLEKRNQPADQQERNGLNEIFT